MTFAGSREMGLLARLDRFVHRTRLDIFTPFGGRRPRNLRWLPLIGIVAAAAGYAMIVIVTRGAGPWSLMLGGAALFIAGLIITSVVPMFGPPISYHQGVPLDERDLSLGARAGHLAGRIMSLLAVIGCFYFGFASMFGSWMPQDVVEWGLLGVVLSGVHTALTVLAASWLQPPIDEEEA